MKLYLDCVKCSYKEGGPDYLSYPAELQDNGYYQFTCRNGHHSLTRLQNQKFEILFELGLNAIHDGYYREAVSSFTSSLERFYEFFIKVMYATNKIDKELFELVWKQVSNQSERQYGAYLFLYAYVEKSAPHALPNKEVQFRNSVIHKGKIPTKNEAIKYGEAIVDVIFPVLTVLKNKYQRALAELNIEHLIQMTPVEHMSKGISEMNIRTDTGRRMSIIGMGINTMCISTALDISTASTTRPNIIKNLESIANGRISTQKMQEYFT